MLSGRWECCKRSRSAGIPIWRRQRVSNPVFCAAVLLAVNNINRSAAKPNLTVFTKERYPITIYPLIPFSQ